LALLTAVVTVLCWLDEQLVKERPCGRQGVDRLPVDGIELLGVAPDGHRGGSRRFRFGGELGKTVAGAEVEAVGDEVLAAARHVVVAGEFGPAGDRLSGGDGDEVRRRRRRTLDEDAEVVDRPPVARHLEEVGLEARPRHLPPRHDHRARTVVGDGDRGDDIVFGREPGAIDFEGCAQPGGRGRTGCDSGQRESQQDDESAASHHETSSMRVGELALQAAHAAASTRQIRKPGSWFY
jgi:hypothetical protein